MTINSGLNMAEHYRAAVARHGGSSSELLGSMGCSYTVIKSGVINDHIVFDDGSVFDEQNREVLSKDATLRILGFQRAAVVEQKDFDIIVAEFLAGVRNQ